MFRRTAAVLACAAVALAATACRSSGHTARSSSVPAGGSAPSTSSSPSSSSGSASPGDTAAAQAVALIPRYLRVLDTAYNSVSVPVNSLFAVSVSPDVGQKIFQVNQIRQQQIHQSGYEKLTASHVRSVDLTATRPTVVVRACVDITGVKATRDGHSVVPKNRPHYLVQTLTIVNIKKLDPESWRVSDAAIGTADTCS